MNYEEKFAKIKGMIDEVACKTKIYENIAKTDHLRIFEIQEKFKNLHADLDKYQRAILQVNIND